MRRAEKARRLGTLLFASSGLSLAVVLANAASPSEAPAESRAQVEAALKALEPALRTAHRNVVPGAGGTIEHAIAAYAPAKYHAVDEGSLSLRSRERSMSARDGQREGAVLHRPLRSVARRSTRGRRGNGPTPMAGVSLSGDEDAGRAFVAQSVAGVVPQGYVSGAQADGACRTARKRLCEPVEWRAACGGSQGYVYPYGPTRVAGKCHDTGVAPMLALHAAELKTGWGPTALNDPRANQLEGTVAKTGAFPDCVSDEGVYDMVGNLDEWTADTNGTFQGGFWLDTKEHGEACAYRTIAHVHARTTTTRPAFDAAATRIERGARITARPIDACPRLRRAFIASRHNAK